MTLIKDDFMWHDDSGNVKPFFSNDVIEQILKNQEDAKQWKIYLDGGINNLFEIVERLRELLKGKTDSFSFTGKQLREEILGEAKT